LKFEKINKPSLDFPPGMEDAVASMPDKYAGDFRALTEDPDDEP
jgi:hypothetical protein